MQRGVNFDAYYNNELIAKFINQGNESFRLFYTSNAPIDISLSLVRGTTYTVESSTNWLKGCLPSPNVLSRLYKELNTHSWSDVLATIGSDIPGAITLVKEGITPVDSRDTYTEFNFPQAVAQVREGLQTDPSLGSKKVSIAGYRNKFTFYSTDFRTFYKSSYQYPSTYICKPGKGLDDHLEYFTMQVTKHLGLHVADTYLLDSAFVTKRFDRQAVPGGVIRYHTEDLTQVLGIDGESEGGYTKFKDYRKEVFTTLRNNGFPEKELALLAVNMCYNTLIGNHDAHLKNYSIYPTEKTISPLYDVIAFPLTTQGTAQEALFPVGGVLIPGNIQASDISWFSKQMGFSPAWCDEITSRVYQIFKELHKGYFDDLLVPGMSIGNLLTYSRSIVK